MYHVMWEIDIDAPTAREAAEKALTIQRNPESTATVFDVQLGDCWPSRIDLEEEIRPLEDEVKAVCQGCKKEFLLDELDTEDDGTGDYTIMKCKDCHPDFSPM